MAEIEPPFLPREQSFPAFLPRVPMELRASLLQIPVWDDESIAITVNNLSPTTTVTLHVDVRLWDDAARELKMLAFDVPCAAGATAVQFNALARGAILTMRVFPFPASGIALGEVFAVVQLVKGKTGAIQGGGVLVQGYTTASSPLGWPGSPLQSLHEGKGVVRRIAWVDAGTILSATVPAGRRWRVIGGLMNLTTSAAAGIRTVFHTVQRGGFTLGSGETTPGQGPGVFGLGYALAPIAPTGVAGVTVQLVPFNPDLELTAADVFACNVFNAQAGDDFFGDGLIVREWFDPL